MDRLGKSAKALKQDLFHLAQEQELVLFQLKLTARTKGRAQFIEYLKGVGALACNLRREGYSLRRETEIANQVTY